NELIVNTTSGPVKGRAVHVLNKSIAQYLNIPFAEPPLGKLRFAKPEPLKHPKQLIDGTKTGNSCPQYYEDGSKHFMGNITQNEDCLVLNVWTDNDNNKTTNVLKPVMFWIHGGGLTMGSSFQWEYNGSALATHDVVVVSVNYRLGWLGFLFADEESAPGNVGLYDQTLALQWVRDNIHEFGGNKDQITIFGESAGSISVTTHLLSPLSKGLFHRAIMQSGAFFYSKNTLLTTKDQAVVQSKQMAAKLNCTDASKWLACLREREAKEFVNPKVMLGSMDPLVGTQFLPMIAQMAFKSQKFNKDLEVMAGVAKHEGSFLAYYLPQARPTVNLTKQDFIKYIHQLNGIFHDIPENNSNIIETYVGTNDTRDGIKWAEYDLFGDFIVTCPTYQFAKNYAQKSIISKSQVYFYEITYQREDNVVGISNKEMDVTHGAELDFVFGAPVITPEKRDTKVDTEFSQQVMKLWTDFAKYGKPANNWPKLLDNSNPKLPTKVYELNPKQMPHIFDNLFIKTCDGLWNDYYN
ncbi:acetylcholinesterase-like, partial [Oppia nitens]|uniref:acetylcholinesterase-like n=1 Tax=Oppia nitens TaxID=1686743 RepID=UPI0023D9B37D